MTGAGASNFAFVLEDSFLTLPGTPNYYAFGRNTSVTDLTVENALLRAREPDQVEAVESFKQNFEGGVSVEAIVNADVHDQVEQLVFNDSGTGFTDGRPSSATIYAGINYLDGTAERALEGTIPMDYSVDYEQGGMTTYSLTMLYADELEATSITPTDVTTASEGASVPFHGTTLTIDSVDVSKLQSASMSIGNISRFQYGGSPTPEDIVIAAPETTLDTAAIFSGPEKRLDLAYGGGSVTSPQDQLDAVTGELDLVAKDGTSVTTYEFSRVKPDTYSWDSLIDAENDLTEPTTFHVNGGVTVA